MEDLSLDERPTPEQWFHRLATHYVEAQALFHLNAVGVFEHLHREGPTSSDELASNLDLVPEVLACLLFYVAGVDGLVEEDAEGRYGISPWGHSVLERYGKDSERGPIFNLFDVRVGAYGPVFSDLSRYLRGEVRYGEGLERKGDIAADAVYKVAARFEEPLAEIAHDLGVSVAVEVGVTTGLLVHLAQSHGSLELFGLDRKAEELAAGKGRAAAAGVGDRVRWIEGNLFDVASWTPDLAALPGPGLLYSVHFHEFLAEGIPRMTDLLRDLRQTLPGWVVLAMEQPLLPPSDRATTSEVEWLYNHSNVLIHHLIGNGRILSHQGWEELMTSAGGTLERVRPLNYLGYRGYALRL